MTVKEFFLRPIGWMTAILIFVLSLVTVAQGSLTMVALDNTPTNAAGKPILDASAAYAMAAITTAFGAIGLAYIIGRFLAHLYEGNKAISSRQ